MDKGRIRLLAGAIAGLTVIAGIAAYFTSDDTVTNAFVASALNISIIEPNWVQDQTIVPEQQVVKDPYIVNTDNTPAYVFMEVTVPAVTVTVEESANNNSKGTALAEKKVPLFRFVTKEGSYATDPLDTAQLTNTGWYRMAGYPKLTADGSAYTYLYAYTGSGDGSNMAVLEPRTTTVKPLFNKVLFCNAREDDTLPGSRQKIDIKAYGIQSEHLKSSDETETDAEKIWQLLT